ncbi:hypothetical protein ACQUW5_07420 [Legionella sp. CNM-1927-20]|uniref:hypothetical protein n=1 Tax=Legionella sp. CNM-1927-20 TaxID=3422221 RepID=UPI00403ABB99
MNSRSYDVLTSQTISIVIYQPALFQGHTQDGYSPTRVGIVAWIMNVFPAQA